MKVRLRLPPWMLRTRPGRRLRRPQGEVGSILPLIFGYAAVALALIVVTTAAASLHLERSRLYTLADGAALAGAGSFDASALPVGADAEPGLSSAGVRRAAAAYLVAATAGRTVRVRLAGAGSPDGRSAVVRLSERWRPPLLSPLLPSGIELEVRSDARSMLW